MKYKCTCLFVSAPYSSRRLSDHYLAFRWMDNKLSTNYTYYIYENAFIAYGLAKSYSYGAPIKQVYKSIKMVVG